MYTYNSEIIIGLTSINSCHCSLRRVEVRKLTKAVMDYRERYVEGEREKREWKEDIRKRINRISLLLLLL